MAYRERQGFAFIEFYEERDAEYAQRKVDREVLDGRELAVVFAKVKSFMSCDRYPVQRSEED